MRKIILVILLLIILPLVFSQQGNFFTTLGSGVNGSSNLKANFYVTEITFGDVDFSFCGDGIVSKPNGDGVTEQCDGSDLNGSTCDDFEASGGNLRCTSSCGYDFTECLFGGGGGGERFDYSRQPELHTMPIPDCTEKVTERCECGINTVISGYCIDDRWYFSLQNLIDNNITVQTISVNQSGFDIYFSNNEKLLELKNLDSQGLVEEYIYVEPINLNDSETITMSCYSPDNICGIIKVKETKFEVFNRKIVNPMTIDKSQLERNKEYTAILFVESDDSLKTLAIKLDTTPITALEVVENMFTFDPIISFFEKMFEQKILIFGLSISITFIYLILYIILFISGRYIKNNEFKITYRLVLTTLLMALIYITSWR